MLLLNMKKICTYKELIKVYEVFGIIRSMYDMYKTHQSNDKFFEKRIWPSLASHTALKRSKRKNPTLTSDFLQNLFSIEPSTSYQPAERNWSSPDKIPGLLSAAADAGGGLWSGQGFGDKDRFCGFLWHPITQLTPNAQFLFSNNLLNVISMIW